MFYLILGFISGSAYAGQRDLNPFLFTHHNLSQFSYVIDGRCVPNSPYKIKVTDSEKNFYQLFYNLFEALNLNDRSNLVTEDNFVTNSFLIAQVIMQLIHEMYKHYISFYFLGFDKTW